MVHHLPNKYIDKMGVEGCEVSRQLEALLRIGQNGNAPTSLFKTETKLAVFPFSTYYSKYYYDPVRTDILSLIPHSVRSVLSMMWVGRGKSVVDSEGSARGFCSFGFRDFHLRRSQESRDWSRRFQDCALTTHRVIREWFGSAGLRMDRLLSIVPRSAQLVSSASLAFMDPLIAAELAALGRTY